MGRRGSSLGDNHEPIVHVSHFLPCAPISAYSDFSIHPQDVQLHKIEGYTVRDVPPSRIVPLSLHLLPNLLPHLSSPPHSFFPLLLLLLQPRSDCGL